MSIKLLIADDEELIREGLASLDWEKLGISVTGTAKNGEEAFALAQNILPDIIISDIRMPKKDGIWLAEQVSQICPGVKMVFLTGYNEFEYAQKAVSFGVSEYILKPIDEDLLFDTVKKLVDAIERSQQEELQSQRFLSTVEESRYFLKGWFFNRLSGNDKKFRFFGLEPSGMRYCVMTVAFDGDDTAETENCGAFLLFEKLARQLDSLAGTSVPFYDGKLLTFVLPFPLSQPLEETERHVFALAGALKDYLDEAASADYTIGIGFLADSPHGLPAALSSAENALKYQFYLGCRQIIYIRDVEPHSDSGDAEPLKAEYLAAIKVGDEAGMKNTLDKLFTALLAAGGSLDYLKRSCLELAAGTSKALYELGQNPKLLFNNTDIWQVINRCQSAEELKQFMLGINQVVILQLAETRENRNETIVSRVKELVAQDYAGNASLDSIAAQIYLSPCYLSAIFSKETGMTFKDYLIQTRIGKAKELLSSTDLKIYEIANKVGYSDHRYFSDLFHRITGATPSQFRGQCPLHPRAAAGV